MTARNKVTAMRSARHTKTDCGETDGGKDFGIH